MVKMKLALLCSVSSLCAVGVQAETFNALSASDLPTWRTSVLVNLSAVHKLSHTTRPLNTAFNPALHPALNPVLSSQLAEWRSLPASLSQVS